MKELIEKLIPLLNESDDMFLIMLLKQKIFTQPVNEYNLTEKNMVKAKSGLLTHLHNWIDDFYSSDEKYIHSRDIKVWCRKCKNSINYTNGGGYFFKIANYNNDKCVRCEQKVFEIKSYYNEKYNSLSKSICETITDDHIKLKALINQIIYKLKKIK